MRRSVAGRVGREEKGAGLLWLDGGAGGDEDELLDQAGCSGENADSHSCRKYLRHCVRTQNPASLASVTPLELKVGCRADRNLVVPVEEVVVRVVLEDEEVVLPCQRDDLDLA